MDQPLSDVDFPIQRSPESIVGRAFVICREGRDLYRERVQEVYEKFWTKRDWPLRIKEAGEKVRGAVGPERAKELAEPIEELRRIVADRKGAIEGQLAQLPAPLKFAPDGTAQLASGWSPKNEGDARLERSKVQGTDCFRVIAEGAVQASWRRSIRLDAGRYRFHARLKTVGVRDGDGAGLRISGRDPVGEWLAGDSDWKTIDYEFEVPDDDEEVVLVAELRARQGEAWFAADSMRLVRAK